MNELKQKKKRLKYISWIKLKMILLDKLTTLKEKKKKRKRIISKWTKKKRKVNWTILGNIFKVNRDNFFLKENYIFSRV